MSILGTAQDSRHRDRKRKPDELLSSVVRETAAPAAVELLRGNTKFAFPSQTAWVILALGGSAIDGLSRRHTRDEAKGSIIQLIDSDQIQTVATASMLDNDFFGIIPTDTTLARMEEYSLLTKAAYAWAAVQQNAAGELVVDLLGEATFQQARQVALGQLCLKEAVGAEAWAEHGGPTGDSEDPADADNEIFGTVGYDEDPAQEAVQVAEMVDVPPARDEDVPEGFDESFTFDETPVTPAAQDEAAAEPGETFEDDPVDDHTVFEAGDDETTVQVDEPAGPTPQASAPEGTYAATQQEVLDAVARRFLSDELELDIRLDEFNATFGVGAPVIQMTVPEGATEWLGDQVAQLSRQANAELAHLHYAHAEQLRTLYVQLMSRHAEQVMLDVATDREGGRYKGLKDKADAIHAGRLAEKDEQVRSRRAEITRTHEQNAKRLGEQAALAAEMQYRERNRAKMERQHVDVLSEVERAIEDGRTQADQEILRIRQADATVRMQRGQTQIFAVLAERQDAHLEAERQLIESWKSEIQRLVDDNRKADISRAQTLAEQQARVDEIGALRAEQTQLVEAMKTEHAERVRRLEAEFERERQGTVARLKSRDEEWQHALNLEVEKTASQSVRVTDLLRQLDQLGKVYADQYEQRLAKVREENTSLVRAMEFADHAQGRSSKLLMVLLVGLAFFGGGVGFILGAGFGG